MLLIKKKGREKERNLFSGFLFFYIFPPLAEYDVIENARSTSQVHSKLFWMNNIISGDRVSISCRSTGIPTTALETLFEASRGVVPASSKGDSGVVAAFSGEQQPR